MCSQVTDTPAAALLRKMATRHDHEGIPDMKGFGGLAEGACARPSAADVDPVRARVMYAVQQPLASSAFTDVMGVPAWKTLPSWYLIAADDQAIPPAAERQFASRMGATT